MQDMVRLEFGNDPRHSFPVEKIDLLKPDMNRFRMGGRNGGVGKIKAQDFGLPFFLIQEIDKMLRDKTRSSRNQKLFHQSIPLFINQASRAVFYRALFFRQHFFVDFGGFTCGLFPAEELDPFKALEAQ